MMATQPPGLHTRSISARPASPPCPNEGVKAEQAATRSAKSLGSGSWSKNPWITSTRSPWSTAASFRRRIRRNGSAGSGRLTLELLERGQEVVAVEPARPLRQLLRQKLTTADHGNRARVIHGFFDELPLPDDFADLVVACSAFTPSSGHGGEAGLSEMERVCRPGGCVAVIWPNNVDWLASHGYRYVCFDGPMCVEFSSHEEAVELAGIFFPRAAEDVARRGLRQVPFEVLRINPPRDLAFKLLAPSE